MQNISSWRKKINWIFFQAKKLCSNMSKNGQFLWHQLFGKCMPELQWPNFVWTFSRKYVYFSLQTISPLSAHPNLNSRASFMKSSTYNLGMNTGD